MQETITSEGEGKSLKMVIEGQPHLKRLLKTPSTMDVIVEGMRLCDEWERKTNGMIMEPTCESQGEKSL